MALSIFLKPKPKLLIYPSRPPLVHRFSSSNDHSAPDDHPPAQQPPPSPAPSPSRRDAFSEIRAKMRSTPPSRPSPVYNRPNNAAAFDKILKNFGAPGTPAAAGGPVSLSDLYQKSYANRPPPAIPTPASFSRSPSSSFAGKQSAAGTRWTLEGAELRLKKGESVEELGRRLAELRPDAAERERREKEGGGGGGGWFSLEELRDRLKRHREIEKERARANAGGSGFFSGLRESLSLLQEGPKKKLANQRFSVFDHSIETPDCTKGPPKEHLVEKYFHPDNMSASEKQKIELAKVRDEFKLSESDCGSARVQVAQLTTKIKYLSSVLKKKDKHSLKGLQAMVQRRKKLLLYLRRTDWDSYCFVLDKLGLRDHADYKFMKNAIKKKELMKDSKKKKKTKDSKKKMLAS